MFGWIAASHQLGAATAAYGGGLLHTWLGDYQVTFMSAGLVCLIAAGLVLRDRKSTRLNSSHSQISYAVFCLKKKKTQYRKWSHHVNPPTDTRARGLSPVG